MSGIRPPRIFDRALLRRRLARALRQGPADFLFRDGLDELAFRFAGVQRPFAHVLDCGSPAPGIAEALAAPGRTVLRMAPVEDAGGDLVGDDETLPFAPASFDCVASMFALQHVNDLPGALAQMRQVLAPDGLLIGALIGGRSLRELRAALTQAEEELSGGASPRVAPFVDLRDFGALLQRAGFALPVADVETRTVRYASLFGLMADLRGFGAANALTQRARKGLGRPVLMRAAQIYAEQNADRDGRLRATFDFIWFSGWAPHESQQKPLAPGSAKARLAEALAAGRPRDGSC